MLNRGSCTNVAHILRKSDAGYVWRCSSTSWGEKVARDNIGDVEMRGAASLTFFYTVRGVHCVWCPLCVVPTVWCAMLWPYVTFLHTGHCQARFGVASSFAALSLSPCSLADHCVVGAVVWCGQVGVVSVSACSMLWFGPTTVVQCHCHLPH